MALKKYRISENHIGKRIVLPGGSVYRLDPQTLNDAEAEQIYRGGKSAFVTKVSDESKPKETKPKETKKTAKPKGK